MFALKPWECRWGSRARLLMCRLLTLSLILYLYQINGTAEEVEMSGKGGEVDKSGVNRKRGQNT